ncbi:hypothetical protein FROZEN_12 [Erwinia phage vB_EamP_Frozen]|uniref:Uncharacterized protein n=3 Tax=Johnsonvirus frozen TaxID=1982578 RepID=A0A191ZCX7_9CAUD|nr:hypothetical protein FROZEN_12 [Erwinia phage vB_EamP_Frozen]ANJ65144.1 hypothetical protein FROZEN_12 [Erwinia phage vB_EamP_Frozen]ANJ65241.1 hypothetical protein REXELLA_12 [Erwinia phage vB_EamP_Rexella]ANJ65328.1 hypothetical protein GUTMEISTER_12 [Erwinia phage vB_EamP_Gutmeister]
MSYKILEGFHAMLPPNAIVPSQLSDISEGDSVKIGVEAQNRTEKFWATVYAIDRDNGVLGVRIDNDLQYSEYHGLHDRDELNVKWEYVVGVIK